MNNFLKFLSLPYPKRKLLFDVLFLLAGIRICLWILPARSLNAWMSSSELPDDAQQSDWDSIRETVALVRLCGRFVPYATCLTQALATKILLRRKRQNCVLRIGVDRDRNQKFLAHAWIEVDGKIIIGKVRDIRRYSIMSHNKEQLV